MSSGPKQRRPSPVRLALLAAMLAAVAESSPPAAAGGPRVARPAAAPASARLVTPAEYYRPVVVGGRAFPLARSTYLSVIEIHRNWHALRLRLIGGNWEPVGVHEGIDISAERGTPIVSMTPGAVENVGWTFYSGTRVGIRGPDGRYYFYAHLSEVEPGIVPGGTVVPGQMIGRVGNTGYGPPGTRDEFPPHLHFGIQVGLLWVNPLSTLESLYDATVGADARAQAELDGLSAKGRRTAWEREAARVYSAFGS